MPLWISTRAKAFMGAVVAGLLATIFATVKSQFGFEVPADIQIPILAVVTGLFVHQTTNTPKP